MAISLRLWWWKDHQGYARLKKKKNEGSNHAVPAWWSGGLSGILPKMTHGTNCQRCTLFRGVCKTLKKKTRCDHTVPGWWSGGLSGILPKIAQWTNDRRCTPFRGVCQTLIKWHMGQTVKENKGSNFILFFKDISYINWSRTMQCFKYFSGHIS